jgi:hypothetical protein
VGKSVQELTVEVIKGAILSYFSQTGGAKEEQRRLYYKLYDEIEAQAKEKTDVLTLEDDRMGLIRKAFRDGGAVPDKLFRLVDEKVAEVKDR